MNALARRGTVTTRARARACATAESTTRRHRAKVDRLERVGLLDDAALAQTLVGLAAGAQRSRPHRDRRRTRSAPAGARRDRVRPRARRHRRRARAGARGGASSGRHSCRAYDRETAVRRLSGFLARRGYSGSTVRAAVEQALPRPARPVRCVTVPLSLRWHRRPPRPLPYPPSRGSSLRPSPSSPRVLAGCSRRSRASPAAGSDGGAADGGDSDSASSSELAGTTWTRRRLRRRLLGVSSCSADGTVGLTYGGNSYDDATDIWAQARRHRHHPRRVRGRRRSTSSDSTPDSTPPLETDGTWSDGTFTLTLTRE